MIEPVAWMVTNDDGQDAYVTADPTLANAGQRALPLYTLGRKDVLILDLYREQHGEALSTLHAATSKVRASAAALGLTIAEWEHKFGTRAAPPLYSQAALNEAAQVAENAERHACSIAVWMTKMDATAEDADDKGVAGWLDEAEQRVKRRGVGKPCGECHLQPGERCDVCGASFGT